MSHPLNKYRRIETALKHHGIVMVAVLLTLVATGVHAASPTPFAAPVESATQGSSIGVMRVTFALVLVVAAVLAAAWMARRVRGLTGGGGPGLQILSQVALGQKERAVLIQVGDRQLLLGVAQGNVRTLHVLEAPATADAPPSTDEDGPERPSFKALLLKSLGK